MKKLLFLGTVIVCLLIINSLVQSIFSLWSKQDVVIKAQKDLDREEAQNKALQAKLKEVKTTGFVEQEARNKLFLVKPGESDVLIPDISPRPTSQKAKNEPNWQKWLEYFGVKL